VRSLLRYEERARKFGISGLDMSQVELDAEGRPTYRMGLDGAPIPAEKYLTRLREFYGDALESGKTWEVPVAIVKRVRSGKVAGNAAIEEIAAGFWQWCADGGFEPV